MTMINERLPVLKVATPCSEDWDRMVGDERVRYCSKCQLNVYNFSEMSREDVVALVNRREGRICGRLYARADGTMITRDCSDRPVSRARPSRLAAAAMSAAMALGSAFGQEVAKPAPRMAEAKLGVISLIVTDTTGAVFAGARVSLTPEHGKAIEGTTDAKGVLKAVSLADGIYEVVVTAPGFEPYVSEVRPTTETLEVRLEAEPTMGVLVEAVPALIEPIEMPRTIPEIGAEPPE